MKPGQIQVFDGLRLTTEHLNHLQEALRSGVEDIRGILGLGLVYEGFEVMAAGDHAVTVQPGLAFDYHKNRLVSDQSRTVQVSFDPGVETQFVCLRYEQVQEGKIEGQPTLIWDSCVVVLRHTRPELRDNLVPLTTVTRGADGSLVITRVPYTYVYCPPDEAHGTAGESGHEASPPAQQKEPKAGAGAPSTPPPAPQGGATGASAGQAPTGPGPAAGSTPPPAGPTPSGAGGSGGGAPAQTSTGETTTTPPAGGAHESAESPPASPPSALPPAPPAPTLQPAVTPPAPSGSQPSSATADTGGAPPPTAAGASPSASGPSGQQPAPLVRQGVERLASEQAGIDLAALLIDPLRTRLADGNRSDTDLRFKLFETDVPLDFPPLSLTTQTVLAATIQGVGDGSAGSAPGGQPPGGGQSNPPPASTEGDRAPASSPSGSPQPRRLRVTAQGEAILGGDTVSQFGVAAMDLGAAGTGGPGWTPDLTQSGVAHVLLGGPAPGPAGAGTVEEALGHLQMLVQVDRGKAGGFNLVGNLLWIGETSNEMIGSIQAHKPNLTWDGFLGWKALGTGQTAATTA